MTDNQCQWIGQGEGCNHQSVADRSYCELHLWQVYQQGTKLAKRKKDLRVANMVREIGQLINEAVEELENEGHL